MMREGLYEQKVKQMYLDASVLDIFSWTCFGVGIKLTEKFNILNIKYFVGVKREW